MKHFCSFLILLCTVCLSPAADTRLERHKTSTSQEFDPEAEVAAFYLDLLAHHPGVKHQFDLLASKASGYGDVHFGTDDPQVIEWFPRTDSWSAGKGFSTDTRFLVIQPLSFSRPRQHDYMLAVVSEFHVVHTGKMHFEPPSQEEKQKLDSNEISITFLGFQNFKLTSLKP